MKSLNASQEQRPSVARIGRLLYVLGSVWRYLLCLLGLLLHEAICRGGQSFCCAQALRQWLADGV